jgi:hypothetical protein
MLKNLIRLPIKDDDPPTPWVRPPGGTLAALAIILALLWGTALAVIVGVALLEPHRAPAANVEGSVSD